jgi:hypothetical protein
MLDLASSLSQIPETRREAPWAGHEYVKGWAVLALPFDTGHVLGLRVLPEGNFVPYRALWHRDPQGRWAIYVDRNKSCACTRYYGAACDLTAYTPMQIEWTGPAEVRVTMDQPAVAWTFRARSDWRLRLINPVNAALPLATWRSKLLVRSRERIAKALGLGDLRLSGPTPSGHTGTLMPEQMYFIDDSMASFDGVDLGRPVHFSENPKIGSFTLPSRGVLARGKAMWRIDDEGEFERRLQEAAS